MKQGWTNRKERQRRYLPYEFKEFGFYPALYEKLLKVFEEGEKDHVACKTKHWTPLRNQYTSTFPKLSPEICLAGCLYRDCLPL